MPYSDESQKRRVIEKFKKKIESYDIDRILSSLRVEVTDYYRSRPGKDDSYYVFREAELEDKSLVVDKYIQNVFGLGKDCIHEATAFSTDLGPHDPDFWKIHHLGKYSGEVLENERKRLKSLYSREEHMAYLFYEQLSKQHKLSSIIANWKDVQEASNKCIKEEFDIKLLSSLEEQFFYDIKGDNSLPEIAKLNNYLHKLQNCLPPLKILFSGTMNNNGISLNWQNNKFYKIIDEKVLSVERTHHAVLLIGGNEDVNNLSHSYAYSNKIEFIRTYNIGEYVSKNPDENLAYIMARTADMIVIMGHMGGTFSILLQQFANELSKPIEIIDL